MRRLVVLVASIVLLDTMLYAALTPLLPDFVERFDLSKTGAGLLVASYAIGVLAGAVPAGFASARLGAKPAALAGLLVMGVASVGFAYADSAWGLGIARFVQGLGSALSWAGGLAWLIGAAPRSRRGELLGTALGAAIVGALLGPVLGGVASVIGEHIAFVGVAVVTVVVALIGAQVPGIPLEGSSMAAIGRAARDPRFLFGFWLMLLAALLFGVLSVISSLDLDRLGWTAVAIGGLYFFNASFEAIFNVFVGRAVDRRGTLPVLRLALPVGIGASLALGWADNAWLDRRARVPRRDLVGRALHARDGAALVRRGRRRPSTGARVRAHERRLGARRHHRARARRRSQRLRRRLPGIRPRRSGLGIHALPRRLVQARRHSGPASARPGQIGWSRHSRGASARHTDTCEGGCMNLKPLGDRLIVEALEDEAKTESGIVLPDTAKEKPQRGKVLAVGPGSRNDNGDFVAMDLDEGDEIIFSKYGGTEIKLLADEYLILRESDVLAKVVTSSKPAAAKATAKATA